MGPGPARHPLVPLIGAQVCLHACMSGTRMAAPLLALQQGRSAWAVGVLLALFVPAPVVLSLVAGRMANRHGFHHPAAIGVAMAVTGGGHGLGRGRLRQCRRQDLEAATSFRA